LTLSRITSAFIFGIFIIYLIIYSSNYAFSFFFTALWFVAIWEWSGLAFDIFYKKLLFNLLMDLLLVLSIFFSTYDIYITTYFSLIPWILFFMSFYFYPFNINSLSIILLGPFLLFPSLFIIIYLHQLSTSYLLFLFLMVWANDVGSYFFGKLIGRVKLAPIISPNKTWEGAIGGFIFTLIASLILSLYFTLPILNFIILSSIISISSVIGDLSISMLKRNRGLKDTGIFLPSHGGILDRLDSTLAASVFFFIGLNFSGMI
tara:strand:+ start:3034 stop:3816 length:783 start_codon:yes stop_codon:yes gene_type:complete